MPPGTNTLMNSVIVASTVNKARQYSAYERCTGDAGAGMSCADRSRSVIWFSLC